MHKPTENLTNKAIAQLSQAYADPAIAAKQRKLVDVQLAVMYAGEAPRHFSVLGELLQGLRERSDLEITTLLDAGCASAYYHEIIDYYVPSWVQYTGVDYNLGMIEMVHRLYPGLPIYKADLYDLSLFADRSYDIVMGCAALKQIQDWKPALGELARVTKRWLILHRESLYWESEPTSCEIVEAYDNQVWSVRFNKDELFDILAGLGFAFLLIQSSDGSPNLTAGQTLLFERKGSQ